MQGIEVGGKIIAAVIVVLVLGGVIGIWFLRRRAGSHDGPLETEDLRSTAIRVGEASAGAEQLASRNEPPSTLVRSLLYVCGLGGCYVLVTGVGINIRGALPPLMLVLFGMAVVALFFSRRLHIRPEFAVGALVGLLLGLIVALN